MKNRVIKFRVYDRQYKCWLDAYTRNWIWGAEEKGFIVQQITEFKDSKNVPIYEGDIISDGRIKIEVIFERGRFGVRLDNKKYSDERELWDHTFHAFADDFMFAVVGSKLRYFKVIGNVVENKKLLK